MRSRKLRWVLALVALLVAARIAVFLASPDPAARITQENIQRVQDGFPMTVAEAEAIFGCPPGDYRTNPAIRMEGKIDCGLRWSVAKWYTDTYEIDLLVEDTGLVHVGGFNRSGYRSSGLDRLRGRAKSLWQQWFP